jgi:hypothetical protein
MRSILLTMRDSRACRERQGSKACLSTSYNLPLSGCCALKLKKTYFALWFNIIELYIDL